MLWSMAKNSSLLSLIKEQIRNKKDLRRTKAQAYSTRVSSLREQIKMKEIIWRQHKRRVSQDPGNTSGKDIQETNFRLYNKLKISTENEIKALKIELESVKKEKDCELKSLDAEIKDLEAQEKICR